MVWFYNGNRFPAVPLPWQITFCFSPRLGIYKILHIIVIFYLYVFCYNAVLWVLLLDFLKTYFYWIPIWIFYWWARQVVRIILVYNSSPSTIGIAFAIIINWPLSLLQMCLDPEYGILMEFWDPSHCSVTFSPSSSFPPSVGDWRSSRQWHE